MLSLFGYDFAADHTALTDPEAGRVDLARIDESLILAKPLDAAIHEGGKRMDAGSWQHRVLKRWIEAGAEYDGTVSVWNGFRWNLKKFCLTMMVR